MKRIVFIPAIFLFSIFILSLAGCGGGGGGNTPTFTPILTEKPAAPGNVVATGGIGQITLSWTPVSNATSYTVYWDTSTGVTSQSSNKESCSTTSYTQAVAAGEKRYYVVTAKNSGGEGLASPEVSATASAPALSYNIGGSDAITINAGSKKFFVAAKSDGLYLFDETETATDLILTKAGTDAFKGAATINGKLYIGINFNDLATMTTSAHVFTFDVSTGKKIADGTLTYPVLIGIAADGAAGILYVVRCDAGGIDWIDAVDVATGQILRQVSDSLGNPTYGAFDGGKYFVQSGVLYALGRALNNEGIQKIKVFLFPNELASHNYLAPTGSGVPNVDSGLDMALSADGKTMVVSAQYGIMPATHALIKIDTATGNSTSTTVASQAKDLAFDASGNLYCLIGTDLVKINVSTMTQTVLASNIVHATLENSSGTLYATTNSSGGSIVKALDLDGNAK